MPVWPSHWVELLVPSNTCPCNPCTRPHTQRTVAHRAFLHARAQPGYEGRKLVGSLGAENRYFDFDKLAEVTRVVTENLNKVGGRGGW